MILISFFFVIDIAIIIMFAMILSFFVVSLNLNDFPNTYSVKSVINLFYSMMFPLFEMSNGLVLL